MCSMTKERVERLWRGVGSGGEGGGTREVVGRRPAFGRRPALGKWGM